MTTTTVLPSSPPLVSNKHDTIAVAGDGDKPYNDNERGYESSSPPPPPPTTVSSKNEYGYEEFSPVASPILPDRPTRRSGLKGLRTVSTQREQENDSRAQHHEFAVQSIRRGSQEWRALVKPFVADLAYYSLSSRAFSRQPLVRPYTNTTAAVLFVDISGYSRIAAALTDRGAHALSTVVNAYLSRLLHIVRQYGGDVVKFAGDAVLCIWHCQAAGSLNQNVLAAAVCAHQLQVRAGTHDVPIPGSTGTTHTFRIHVGLCAGTVESEIFDAPVHVHMQRLFHLVGGEALQEIGCLVDAAAAGQVCVSSRVARILQTAFDKTQVQVTLAQVDEERKHLLVGSDIEGNNDDNDNNEELLGEPLLLTGIKVSNEMQQTMDAYCEEVMVERLEQRGKCLEEDFIHPAVLDLLSHGGSSPTQIAQMRDLVVLFIGQTSHGAPANWLLQVQAVLDRNQCPLLQIVDDDKGVHAIAAVNAVSSVPESRLLGLEIGRQLVQQEIGVAVGMAAGPTFCGVTGSSSVSCRWDITGAPAVRAARLMQYALKHEVPLAIDESLSRNSNTVPARMTLLQADVAIKGSPAPIRIYTLSEATEFAAMNLLETVHSEMHNPQVEEIRQHITGKRHRSAVVVTGPTLSGKKIVCQRAAGFAEMVPFLHTADSSYGLLQLVRTVAKWFKYTWDYENVRTRAKQVLNSMDSLLYSRAHDECLALVDDAMEAGLVACFIVDRVEFLDGFSLSFIRECLHGRKYRQSFGKIHYGLRRPQLDDSISNLSLTSESQRGGRIAFLCGHVPLYNSPEAQSVADDITRSHRSLSVPIIEVGPASLEQFREMTSSSMSASRFDDRLLYAGSAAAGHCAGYFIERSAAIGQMQPGRIKAGLKPLLEMTEDLVYTIPAGCLRTFRKITVMQVGPHIAMRYGHVYDELPPIMQVLCKVLAVVGQTEYYWPPRNRIWEVLNDLIAQGVDNDAMSTILDEMKCMYLVQVWVHDGVEFIKFQSPAMADIALDVCTPIQVESIAKAWIGRLDPDKADDFRVSLVLAWLHNLIDPCRKCALTTGKSNSLWQEGYRTMLSISEKEDWEPSRIDRWKELIASEIEESGRDVLHVLGSDFSYNVVEYKAVEMDLFRLWMYRGPIGLGPLGNTLSVLSELLTREAVVFLEHVDPNTQSVILQYKRSASDRYMIEVELVEELLSEYSLGVDVDELYAEKECIERLGKPASGRENIYELARLLVGTIMPRFVEPRLERVRELMSKLKTCTPPPFVANVSCDAVRNAYTVMFEMFCSCQTQGSEVDSAQHALMVMAACGWEPRPTPEPMGHLKRQTVARLRNAVVRKLSEGQLHFSRHQQSAVDLKAFLIITALLFDAQDTGRYTAG